MGPIRHPRRATALVSLLVLVAGVVVACASGAGAGSTAQNGYAGVAGADLASTGDTSKADAPAPAASSGPGQAQLTQYQQQIVKTGEITLQVSKVADASSQVRTLAATLGGYVGGSQAGTLEQSATLTLRIPAARFDDAISRLHEIGDKVLSESTREEDVTAAVVDLDARLKNLQASEVQYRTLMAKAAKIDDILAVQSRLDDVQGQIEELSAQLKQLTDQAALSTLTVTLQPAPQPITEVQSAWDPGSTLSQAVSALLAVGQALLTGAIWLAIVGLPILIVVAILILMLVRLGLLRRPARPVAPASPEG